MSSDSSSWFPTATTESISHPTTWRRTRAGTTGPRTRSGGDEVVARSDRVLDERVGQALSDCHHGLPTGAVGGHDEIGVKRGQRVDRRPDDRVEHRPTEM